ncbi:MAG: hypothetical protein MJK12_12085 [Colwellia sp.]|nr:hypothetical protein [Colwellia sp.]
MGLYKGFLLSILVLSANVYADVQIDGIWKHTQKPAWLEIKFQSGVGALSVQRHDNNIKAAGLNVIKNIKPVINQSSQWAGQMYSAAEGGYVDVVLILINSSTITIFESSDLDKANEILRITRE